MARTETVVLICDDPRHYAEYEAVTTRTLTVDGTSYEIDLCGAHDKEYTDALAPFVDHARRVTAATTRKTVKRDQAARRRTAEVREWWGAHPVPGVQFTERGRIPATVSAAYAAARGAR